MATPSTSAAARSSPDLSRGLRRWDLVALVLNTIIGAGIFGLPARAFALAGTYSLLGYLLCAVLVVFFILCFAEVGSRFATTGGPYIYAREAFGRFAGFEMGWLLWLARVTAFGSLSNLLIGYLAVFIPSVGAGVGRTVVITVLVLALTAINIIGVRPTAIVTNVFTIAKLAVLVGFVVVGLFFIEPSAYSLAKEPTYAEFSRTVLLLVFAFSGFEMAVIPAGEIVNPSRDLPFALLTGIAVVAVLYMAIQTVAIGTLPDLATSQRPIADAAARMLGAGGAAVVAAGAVISTSGTLNSMVFVTPRILFAMAEDGHLPRVIASVHPRLRTPQVAVVVSSLVMYVLTLTGTFVGLAAISTVIRLLTYGATCAALVALRRKANAPPAGFRAPMGVAAAFAALALTAWLLSTITGKEARVAGLTAAAGVVYYFVARAVRSRAPATPPA